MFFGILTGGQGVFPGWLYAALAGGRARGWRDRLWPVDPGRRTGSRVKLELTVRRILSYVIPIHFNWDNFPGLGQGRLWLRQPFLDWRTQEPNLWISKAEANLSYLRPRA